MRKKAEKLVQINTNIEKSAYAYLKKMATREYTTSAAIIRSAIMKVIDEDKRIRKCKK